MLWRADKKQHTRNKENWIINNTGAILKEKAKITLLFVLRLHHEGVKKKHRAERYSQKTFQCYRTQETHTEGTNLLQPRDYTAVVE